MNRKGSKNIKKKGDIMLDKELIKKYQDKYANDPSNKAVENAIAKNGINASSLDNTAKRKHNFVFSDVTKRGNITNQKSSGRCWMFANLNTARINVMEKLNIKNFEFSQTYTFFWDKLEKSNFFLESIIETADEPLNSRVVWHLLQTPQEDGGQYDMFVGILKKYGSVPKECMPETYHSENTYVLETVLNNKLREFASVLRKMHAEGKSDEELRAKKDEQLYFVYNLLVKTLGEAPRTFDYSYRDKDDKFHRLTNQNPVEFFETYSGLNLDSMVNIINAPTADKPYEKTYTVKLLGSVKEAPAIKYVNLPVEDLKASAIKAIHAGVPVWCGCDVGKFSDSKLGIMDDKLFDYEATLGEGENLTKAERLDYGDSLLTHAMVLTGVDLDENGNVIKWQVENSWGKDAGDEGIFSMSDSWFDEYTYQVTVDRKFVDDKILDIYDNCEITELEPWDPMGSLAM